MQAADSANFLWISTPYRFIESRFSRMREREASMVPATSSAPMADETLPGGGTNPDPVPEALGI